MNEENLGHYWIISIFSSFSAFCVVPLQWTFILHPHVYVESKNFSDSIVRFGESVSSGEGVVCQ